jgi:hypothetical protein
MLRRSLLRGAAALALVPRVGWAGTSLPRRRVRPMDPAWPNADDWDSLNKAVGGRLVEPEPLLEACIVDRQSDAC